MDTSEGEVEEILAAVLGVEVQGGLDKGDKGGGVTGSHRAPESVIGTVRRNAR